jgi:hypothetical protein
MSRWRAYLAVALLFALGVVVGVLATHAFYAYRLHRPGGMVDLAMAVLATDLRRTLDLDPEQQVEVDRILAASRDDLVAIRGEVIARIRANRARSFAELEAVLRPEQREALHAFRARQSSRLEALVGESLEAEPATPPAIR